MYFSQACLIVILMYFNDKHLYSTRFIILCSNVWRDPRFKFDNFWTGAVNEVEQETEREGKTELTAT